MIGIERSLSYWMLLITPLLLMVWGISASAAESPKIIINEVNWAGSALSTADEWLELKNLGSEAVDLSGWLIESAGLNNQPLVLPAGLVIGPSGLVLITNFSSGDPRSTLAIQSDWSTSTLSLSNSQLSLTLKTPLGEIIDEVGSAQPPAGENQPKSSMERRVGIGGREPNAWYSSNRSINLTELSQAGTPKAENSPDPLSETAQASWRHLMITEILPKPATDSTNEFIELFNRGPQTIQLTGWQLDDEAGAGSKPYRLPALTSLQPGEYSVFYHHQTNLGLNDDGDRVRLIAPDGSEIDTTPNYQLALTGQSWARTPENQWQWTPLTTPGLANQFPAVQVYPKTIFINELLPDPQDLDETGEWLELKNAGETVVDLSGWQLDDAADQGSRPFTVSATTLIYPRQFKLFRRSETRIAFNNEGDTVRLLAPDHSLIDQVDYGESREGESYNRIFNGEWLWSSWPTPGQENLIRGLTVLSTLPSLPVGRVAIQELFKYDGLIVTIEGTVQKLFGQGFYLEENGYSARVSILKSTGIEKPSVKVGELVQVTGRVDEDEDDSIWRVLPQKAENIVLISGKPSQSAPTPILVPIESMPETPTVTASQPRSPFNPITSPTETTDQAGQMNQSLTQTKVLAAEPVVATQTSEPHQTTSWPWPRRPLVKLWLAIIAGLTISYLIIAWQTKKSS